MTAAILASGCMGGIAHAEVKEFQVARLVELTTSCNLQTLDAVVGPPGQMHFKATCRNLISYPDGIDVACLDAEDERSCAIRTPEKVYRHIDMFRRR